MAYAGHHRDTIPSWSHAPLPPSRSHAPLPPSPGGMDPEKRQINGTPIGRRAHFRSFRASGFRRDIAIAGKEAAKLRSTREKVRGRRETTACMHIAVPKKGAGPITIVIGYYCVVDGVCAGRAQHSAQREIMPHDAQQQALHF